VVDAFGNALGQGLVDQQISSGPTLTTGDFARMDGASYRSMPYEPPNAANGLSLGGSALGLGVSVSALKDWSDGVDGGIALYAQRDSETDTQAAQARALAQRRTAQLGTAPAQAKVVSEWDDNSTPLPSFANKPATVVAASSNSLWNRIGSIDETMIPGLGWLSREQAVSSSLTWRDKLDATGNPTYAVLQGVADLWANHSDEVGMVLSMGKGLSPVKAGEVTTYKSFADRSVIGDNIEGHEVWQNANLKANGLAPERLSTVASQENPVLALDRATHQEVTAMQRSFDPKTQTPIENIQANTSILRQLGVASEATITKIEQWAIEHAQRFGFFK
jgi:hypothetical protein